jgi:glycosyltransferase involved in cell wall biosynthesis
LLERPHVSVLIANVNGSPMIESCLEALESQESAELAEIIVADATDDETRAMMARRFPHVRVLAFPRRTSIPVLRTAAFDASRAPIVAVTEDHCIPSERWLEEILRAHHDHAGVVGGPVENGSRERLVDWAVYFCEYARNMSPVADGESHDIPGVNAAYKRELLARHRNEMERGFWEGIIHPMLIAEGVRFISSPRIVVLHKKRFGYFYFMSQRFHYSRYYAGTRVAGAAAPKRLAYAAATVLLPPLLALRITREVWRKRRHLGTYALSFPILKTFVCMWAIGECAGYLFGPGESLSRIE